MAVDLDSMSKEELQTLKKNVDKALTSFEKRQREAALAAAQKAAQEHGFSLDDILGKKAAGKTSVPKYRNPQDATQTWSGVDASRPGTNKRSMRAPIRLISKSDPVVKLL